MGGSPNIWSDVWEVESDDEWSADCCTRLARGEKIGATLYELRPATKSGHYHFHHGAEELLGVLTGAPTLARPVG